MKIRVKYEASETQRTESFDIETDLGITPEEWARMSDSDKRTRLSDAVEHEAPYWRVEEIDEE